MIKELVSIVMPSFNSQNTISESIESVLGQTYQSWELLVTDDCSDDGTINIVEKYAKRDRRIKFTVNKVNCGAGGTRNKSIERAEGRFIAFLDSDDVWHPKKLESQIDYMLQNEIALSYTAYQKVVCGELKGVVIPPKSTSYEQLLYSNVIGCLTAIYDSKILGKRYMPLIRKRQDMGLWLDILSGIDKAYCLEEVLAYYRVDTGMTKNKIAVLSYQWRFYRDVIGLGVLKSIYVFFIYAIKGFLKSKL